MSDRAKIAIAAGDPAGIGPEISLKAALDPAVCSVCNPIVVGDPAVIARHAGACGLKSALRVIERVADADWSDHRLNVLACAQPDAAKVDFGTTSAASGRAALAFARAAIAIARAGEVDAVVAAPQNETSIALAGIAFDGYPSFVAHATGTDENDVYLMLCFGDMKIVHATLHRSVSNAIAMITRDRVVRVIRAAARALSGWARRRRSSRSAASIPTPAKVVCSAARRSRSSGRRSTSQRPRGSAQRARSGPTSCSICKASMPSSSCCTTRGISPRSCLHATPSQR